MMQKSITKEELYKLLDSLLQDFEAIGPKELANRGIFYETIKNPQDLYLGEGFTIEPVKKFFLSPSEDGGLFEFVLSLLNDSTLFFNSLFSSFNSWFSDVIFLISAFKSSI